MRVYTATLPDGRVYRTIVPPGSWKLYCATPEEWISGVAGVPLPHGTFE